MADPIEALAANIVDRKRAGAEPYVLFLGAGASISSGSSGMPAIVDDVLRERDGARFDCWQAESDGIGSLPEQYRAVVADDIARRKRQRFFELWNTFDLDTRYAILRRHLAEDCAPASGYRDLAHLIKAGYFQVVLTTTLDTMLEQALEDVGWYPALRRDRERQGAPRRDPRPAHARARCSRSSSCTARWSRRAATPSPSRRSSTSRRVSSRRSRGS